jgi:hypothetical protein
LKACFAEKIMVLLSVIPIMFNLFCFKQLFLSELLKYILVSNLKRIKVENIDGIADAKLAM